MFYNTIYVSGGLKGFAPFCVSSIIYLKMQYPCGRAGAEDAENDDEKK